MQAIKDDQWDIAREAAHKAIGLAPSHSGLLCAYGAVLEHLGDAEAADRYYKRSIDANATNLDALYCPHSPWARACGGSAVTR